ncbi:MAG: divalent-cation tolerance protein CutA [Kangiellaceae bacterium]|nr:divalent-cation tolerance protein CutA [Kangiellaceae bacterium]
MCLTTVDDESTARQIAKSLLQQKLVACVNISARSLSLYHWQGEIAEDHEFLLQMKTNAQKIGDLEHKLRDLHPYEVPEFIVLDIVDGATDYLSWINSSLS